MDNEPKSASSIEEDIEEAITNVSSSDEGVKTKSDEAFAKKKEKLFDLDDPGGNQSPNYSIDADPLPAASLAKHFKPEHSEPAREREKSKKDDTCSQRTENDVSEIEDTSQLYIRSLDLRSSLLDVDPRDCLSLDSKVRIIQPRPSHSDNSAEDNFERDHSVEEVMESNHSIEFTLNEDDLGSLDPNIDIDNESQINKILSGTNESIRSERNSQDGNDKSSNSGKSSNSLNKTRSIHKSGSDEDDMNELKKKILSHPANSSNQKGITLTRDNSCEDQSVVVKRMERVDCDISKEALDDITEESEKGSQQLDTRGGILMASANNDNTSNDLDSIISLNMIQMLENKVKDLQEIVASKDVCLESLNMQLDSAQRRESFAAESNRDSFRDLPPSGRDSSSLATTTTSTEYRTVLNDVAPKVFDFHAELIQRDHLIEKLTDSLEQCVSTREQLQNQSEKLATEVQQLRKTLADTLDQIKKPKLLDLESSTTGQRISEISIDLVSESDDDLERHFLTDNEEKMSTSNRNSRERQLGENISGSGIVPMSFENFEPDPFFVSKQIEQFQKYLNPDEVRIFFMVQKKFDDFLSQEIEKVKMKCEAEVKTLTEQLETERCEKEDLEQRRFDTKCGDDEFMALLSEPPAEDNHWPPELILLREKFTAKSQLEIVQLQIKHEDEMSRLKADYEKQLKRKNKRNSTFDLSRDLDEIVNERDNLRELSTTFRNLLQKLAKCVSFCEDDLNNTIIDQLHTHGILGEHNVSGGGDNDQSAVNLSTQSNQQLQDKISKSLRLVPDVSGLLSIVEDQTLIDFIADNYSEGQFKLKECLDKLKTEANVLLLLSEKLSRNREKQDDSATEKPDSCEEEDGLKANSNHRPTKIDRANSLNEAILREANEDSQAALLSLPADINRLEICTVPTGKEEVFSSHYSPVEGSVNLNDLQNRLVKSESDRLKLIEELQTTISRNEELGRELNLLREQLKQLDVSQREDLSEGYGISEIQSPPRLQRERNASSSFAQLQDRARNLLSTPTKNMSENTSVLLHLIEEFCREGDKVTELSKRERDDLQAQIDAADNKLKDTRQFLDLQASEREAERDEFVKKIEKLKSQIREKEKECSSFKMASKEFEQMEQEIRELTQQVSGYEAQKDKLETELEASIDKIFDLREIITELETQVDTKALNENVLNEKVKELDAYIASQARSNETLQQEVESLKSEIGLGYQERIAQLEGQLRNARSNSEQNLVIEQFTEQLRDIETTLDQKTKILESLHATNSNSFSENYSEDVSVQNLPKDNNPTPEPSPINTPRHHSLPIDEVQRVFQKLSKHTRVEEAAIKRIKDLEMQVANIRTSYAELEVKRKVLQEKMGEQVLRISSLQSKLDEQRRRAEELNRQGTSDFAARIHDLQSEVFNLKETLSTREKQITNLKNHLEQSKALIDRQEAELAVKIQGDTGRVSMLEAELKSKTDEIKHLKEKMKKEMINKLALPDLMETMLADKNEEIDHLKEQLERKEKELQDILNINLGQNDNSSKDKSGDQCDGSKNSGRTLSDIVSISEYDEPDVIRRAVTTVDTHLDLPHGSFPEKTMESSKCATGNRTDNTTMFDLPATSNVMRTFDQPNFFTGTGTSSKVTASSSTPTFIPRQINFSEFADETKVKSSTPQIHELPETESEEIENLKRLLKSTEDRAESLKLSLEATESEKSAEIRRLQAELQAKSKMHDDLMKERNSLEKKLANFTELEQDLKLKSNTVDNLSQQLSESQARITSLEKVVAEKTTEIDSLKTSLAQKLNNATDSNEKILDLNHEIDLLKNQLRQKDDALSKTEKNLRNVQDNEISQMLQLAQLEETKDALQAELDSVRAELTEKTLLYQNLHLKLDAQSKKERSSDETTSLRQKIHELEERNATLESELERLRSQSGELKPYSLDEIAEKVEKELNYSAQLDSNILKAIESEDETNLCMNSKTNGGRAVDDNLISQIDALKSQLESEHKTSASLQQQLGKARAEMEDIQKQDADIIEALRVRLEEAIEKEAELHKVLDEERGKCERLTNQLTVLQRTEARKSSQLQKSPPESPRKAARAAEDAETIERLKEEAKLISAQVERERERVNDLQKVLEREKSRFDKELAERVEYAEKLKREMDKLKHDKDLTDEEAEHLQERLTSASREIETLENRLSTLQEAETRRAYRRGKERAETTQNALEIQELRNKVAQFESERDHLNEVIKLLREDVDRGAQREAKLAGALANAGTDNSIPEQFMQKLKEMNYLLSENAKENRQMAETLQYLTDERKMLQRKCEELETTCQTGALAANTLSEMEERANHLFGKYLRVESHRKALVHQKRYLMIVVQTYQENEAKALNLLNAEKPRRKKRRSFKSVALVVIAIERMKFIVRRWHTGKIVVSKSIFNMVASKRSPSSLAAGTTSNVLRSGKQLTTFANIPLKSPLQSPALISECSDKLDWTNRWKQS